MAAPSTVPQNPLAQSLAAITGENALSTDTGTSPIGYEGGGGFRQPGGDIIQISGEPGTGATTAETWAHEVALENLKMQQAQFAFSQQQNAMENARAQAAFQLQQQQYASMLAEQQRQFGLAQGQFGLSQGQFGIQQSQEARAAQLGPYAVTAAQLANQGATLDVAKKQQEADAYAAAQQMAAGANDANRFLGGQPVSPASSAQLSYLKSSGTYVPGQTTYNPNMIIPSSTPQRSTIPGY